MTSDPVGLEQTRPFLATLRGIIWLAAYSATAYPDRTAEVLGEHRRVVAAIAAHDVPAAEAAIREPIVRPAAAANLDR